MRRRFVVVCAMPMPAVRVCVLDFLPDGFEGSGSSLPPPPSQEDRLCKESFGCICAITPLNQSVGNGSIYAFGRDQRSWGEMCLSTYIYFANIHTYTHYLSIDNRAALESMVGWNLNMIFAHMISTSGILKSHT